MICEVYSIYKSVCGLKYYSSGTGIEMLCEMEIAHNKLAELAAHRVEVEQPFCYSSNVSNPRS